MTRVNCIDPLLLSDRHLLSEYRELPRIFTLVRNAQNRGDCVEKYRTDGYILGAGHCKQFYLRLRWLLSRQKALVAECIKRGFKIQYTEPEWLVEGIAEEWLGDWCPTDVDKQINIVRINERGGLRV